MYTKDVNARSPLRVFEKSTHGGLGKGNLGVVMSRAGVGKTAFLIGVALDDLMRGRNVLHISNGDSVDHAREFYEEIFNELRHSAHIQDASLTSYLVERHRIIHTYRGVEMDVARIQRDTTFYRDHAGFTPEVVVVDGFDFNRAAETDLAALKDFAASLNVELWLSALTHREEPVTDPRGVPNPVARFDPWIAVMVVLEPLGAATQIRLLKDHDNPDVEQLHMKLDPRTLLLAESA
jgi:hypothetical protein